MPPHLDHIIMCHISNGYKYNNLSIFCRLFNLARYFDLDKNMHETICTIYIYNLYTILYYNTVLCLCLCLCLLSMHFVVVWRMFSFRTVGRHSGYFYHNIILCYGIIMLYHLLLPVLMASFVAIYIFIFLTTTTL